MPATGDRITKRGDGRWMGRYTVQTSTGPERKSVYGRSYKEAEKLLAVAMGDAARGIVYDENQTVGKYMIRWLSDSAKHTVKATSYRAYESQIRNHIVPALGKVELSRLRPAHLQSLYAAKLREGMKPARSRSHHESQTGPGSGQPVRAAPPTFYRGQTQVPGARRLVHQRTVSRYTLNQLAAATPGMSSFTMADITEEAIGIITPRQPFPLKDGAEIRRMPARLRNEPIAQIYMNPEFVFGVAFGEVEVVEGKPLIPTLGQLTKFVEDFVKLFPPLFN